jgi:hypothetical protein
MKHPTIRPLESRDVAPISAVFSGLGWNKPRLRITSHLSEQQRGIRTVFVAFVGGDFAGYVIVEWHLLLPALSGYRHPGDPRLQRAAALQAARDRDEAERKVSERSGVAGIG